MATKPRIIVPVKEGENVERALKRYKKKFEKAGILKEIRERQHYIKKSVKRRQEILRAIYREKMKRKSL